MAENLSGVPPAVSLSGLDAGAGGFSGATQQGLGGSSAYGQTPFGMTGGMDLNSLMQLLGGGETAGVGTGGDIGQSLAQGSLGQQQGGFGAGAFGQTQPGYTAGQSASGSPMSMGAGSADPFALIQKTLGLAQKGVGMAAGAANTASPTGGSDLSLQGPLFQPEGGAGQVGTASPTLAQDMQGGLMGTSALQDPTLGNLFTNGSLNGWDGSQASLEAMMASDPALKAALFGGEVGGSLGETLSAPGGSAGFSLGTGNEQTASPANWAGAAQGGIGGTMGLLNLISGIESGNGMQGVGGGLQSIGGLAQLLQQGGLGGSLGAAGSGIGGLSALGSIGAGAGGLGGLLGLFGGAQTLAEGGDTGSGAMQLGSGALGTYGALSSLFPSVFPSITSAIASALGIGGGAAAGGAAAGAAGAAAASGSMGGASAAGTAAGSAVAAPLAMIMGPYLVAKAIQAIHSMGPDKANARELGNRVSNIYGQLPGELQTLSQIPSITSQLSADSTPEQAAGILKQLNEMQSQYQTGGWESHQKTGLTSVKTVGDESGGGFSGGANIPEVQAALDQMNPLFNLMNVTQIRAQDMLGKAGWTPEMIQQQTGRYISPQEWAMNLNSQTYKGFESGSREVPEHAMYPDFNPTFNSQFRPYVHNPEGQPGHYEQPGAVGGEGGGWQATPQWQQDALGGDMLNTSYGAVNRGMWDQLAAMQPGNMEQGLMQYLQQYGGVNPGMMQMGFGQGFGPQAQQPMQQGFAPQTQGVDPTVMAASMSPQASTNGTAQGMMTEETLMDLLRRMQIGGM